MQLNLQRPIIFFDIEATGLDISTDRIVELCLLKILPSGEEIERVWRFNPGKVIPEEVVALTGITNKAVADCPSFGEKVQEVADFLKGCDLAGFNSNRFDVPLLVEEMIRNGVDFDPNDINMVDVQTIYHKMEPRTLSAAYKHYCHKELEGAHGAAADTRATYDVLCAQLDTYAAVLKNDMAWLSDFSSMNRNVDLAGRIVRNEANEAVFNFGKYRGQEVIKVLEQDPGYYNWILQGNFTQNTKQVLRKLKIVHTMQNK